MINMTFEEFKQVIVDTVTDVQGCKATELIAHVAGRLEEEFPQHDFMRALNELLESGELEEVEYVLPQMDYRTKSFLLPKNTQIFLGSDSNDKEDDS